MPPVYAWQHLPSPAELADRPHAAEQEQHWLFCLDDDVPPPHRIALPAEPSDNSLAAALQAALACTGTTALHHFPYAWGKVHFWFVPRAYADQCQVHFAVPIQWQDAPVRPAEPPALKAWQAPPEPLPFGGTPHVLVIGAGIAGAATAYECALRGATVSVIERQKQPAQEASGNRQGLLYAKISPHDTPQTELLLSGYGYTRHLLARLLPEQVHWQPCGVLHLNHNESERQRNRLLAQQTQHAHLYRAVCAEEAAQLAGIPIGQDGLFWPMGAWLHPTALVERLLDHPNIRLLTEHNVEEAAYDSESRQWRVRTPHGTLSGSHIVFCTGAGSLHAPITRQFSLQIIRANQHRARHRRQPRPQNRPVRRQLHFARMAGPPLFRRHLRPEQPRHRMAGGRRAAQPPSPVATQRTAVPQPVCRMGRRKQPAPCRTRTRRPALRCPRPPARRRRIGRCSRHETGVCQIRPR